MTLWGVVDRVAAIVVGRCVNVEERWRPSNERLEDVVARCCDGLDIPVLLDVDPGHTAEKLTLPIGAQTTEGRTRRCPGVGGPRPATSR